MTRWISVHLRTAMAIGLASMASTAAAQNSGGERMANASNATSGADTRTVVRAQQQLADPTPRVVPAVTAVGFRGSLVAGKSTGTTLALSLDEAMARGLRQNLGVILPASAEQNANGQRLEQLQNLLPTITAAASISVQQVNLAAFGLKFPGVKRIVGPFQVVDFRAYLNQSVFNLSALQDYLAAKHNFAAARLSAADAKDLVVLTVGNAYLLCLADAARIEAVNAEMASARVSLDQATAAHDAGTSPKLDVLRAQVDLQNEQQNLISTTNQLAKDKLALARTIGLPLDQEFRLTDLAPYAILDNVDPDAALQQALTNRKDLQAAAEQVKAAAALSKAARAELYPTASVSGDFGDLGTTAAHSHGTYTAAGQVSVPVLQIARTRGDRETAAAQFNQAKARLSDQAEQIDADIRSSILDIQAASKLVEATRSNVELATEALSEAQQRFHAGISDSFPVSQARAQTELANDEYISALYRYNVAKLSLARALGVAQTSYKSYLGGK